MRYIIVDVYAINKTPKRDNPLLKMAYLLVDDKLNIISEFKKEFKDGEIFDDFIVKIKNDFKDSTVIYFDSSIKKFLKYEFQRLGVEFNYNLLNAKKNLNNVLRMNITGDLTEFIYKKTNQEFKISDVVNKCHSLRELCLSLDLTDETIIELRDNTEINMKIKTIKFWTFKEHKRIYVGLMYETYFTTIFFSLKDFKWRYKDNFDKDLCVNFFKVEEKCLDLLKLNS
ncbi:MAG: hypothetical protein R3Y64_10735, partial [Peptostreptococcaceae bacterium]